MSVENICKPKTIGYQNHQCFCRFRCRHFSLAEAKTETKNYKAHLQKNNHRRNNSRKRTTTNSISTSQQSYDRLITTSQTYTSSRAKQNYTPNETELHVALYNQTIKKCKQKTPTLLTHTQVTASIDN